MIYQGRELVELKFDTMQHWPEGIVAIEPESECEVTVISYTPGVLYQFAAKDDSFRKLYAKPTVTKRRVTRAECAGMAVLYDGRIWTPSYNSCFRKDDWDCPMDGEYTDRALTLDDALAGRTLGMEVEG